MADTWSRKHLSYLPFHFLLASAGHAGWLKYNDVSTGQFVAEHNTKAGAPRSLAPEPADGRFYVWATATALVSLWSPARVLAARAVVMSSRGGLIQCPSVGA